MPLEPALPEPDPASSQPEPPPAHPTCQVEPPAALPDAPSGLREVPSLAGPASAGLFATLAELPVADVVDDALVGALGAGQRLIGAVTAQMLVATAELHARRVGPLESDLAQAKAGGDLAEIEWAIHAWDIGSRAVHDEVALELTCSRTVAGHHVETALALTGGLTRTLDALAAGELEPRKVSVIADLLATVEDAEIRARIEDEVLRKVRRWTVPTLRQEIKKLTLKLGAETAAAAYEKACSKRRVVFSVADDDMMELWASQPADDGARLRTALDIAADAAQAPGDQRTADQRRLDALVDVVCAAVVDGGSPADGRLITHARDCCSEPQVSGIAAGGNERADPPAADAPGVRLLNEQEKATSRKRSRRSDRRGLRPEVQVVVLFETITGDADEPGYLARYGPISSYPARKMAWDVAADGVWRCVVTDDVHGTVLGLGTSTFSPGYEPPEKLRRLINARDRHCTFPGCRTAAAVCDKDHQEPWPRGATCDCNLFNRCTHHHRVKHETRFGVRFSNDAKHPPGTVIWTSPTGREYPEFPAVIGIPKGKSGAAKPQSGQAMGEAGPAKGEACSAKGEAGEGDGQVTPEMVRMVRTDRKDRTAPDSSGRRIWRNPEPPPY